MARKGDGVVVDSTEGGIEPGVYGVGSLIEYAPTVVCCRLRHDLKALRGTEGEGVGGAQPKDEGFGVLCSPEDEALPVDPRVQSALLPLVAYLQTDLGVSGEL